MIPTIEEYNAAKEIVIAYETEQDRLYKLKVDAFEADLKVYFANNLIDGLYTIKQFELRDGDIIPLNPCLEENYEGGNNDDIKKLCEKHGVKFSMIYWTYHK